MTTILATSICMSNVQVKCQQICKV